jgi:hypothetical protein
VLFAAALLGWSAQGQQRQEIEETVEHHLFFSFAACRHLGT